MDIRAIIFDVDGTLFTSDAIVLSAYAGAITEYNAAHDATLPVPTLSAILNQLGNPGRVLLKNLFPDLPERSALALSAQIRKRLIQFIHEGKGRLFPYVRETLGLLHAQGYLLRVASNGNKDYIQAVLDHYRLTDFFGPFIGLDNADLKDKGDILNLYKSLLSLHDREMVMVGDRRSDLEAALKTGCFFLGLPGGHGSAEELKHPTSILLTDFSQVPEAVANLRDSD
ncbi:MAG: HAD family hydrolase [Fibrobacterota bacterium]